MPTSQHRIAFDETGSFAPGRPAEEWAIVAVVSAPGAAPAAATTAWEQAWKLTGLAAPPLHEFHAARKRRPQRMASVAAALAGLSTRGFDVVAVGGRADPEAPGVAYLEGAIAAVVEAARSWHAAPAVVDVWSARRSPLNLLAVERLARARMSPLWLGPDGARPNVAVNWHVSTPYDDASLAWSDLLGWLALQSLRGDAKFPFPLRLLDPKLPNWRLRPEDVAASESRSSGPKAAPGRTPTLEQALRGLAQAEVALERTRNVGPAEGSIAFARALPTAGLAETDLDNLTLATESLELALDSHAGAPIPRHCEPGPDPRSSRLLAAGRGVDTVLLYENRRVVARTHSWQFSRVLEEFRPVVAWMGDVAASPFGSPAAQPELGRMLGTLGQLIALDAHARNDAPALDEADACFEQALAQFGAGPDRERQTTYRLHLLAERIRLRGTGWTEEVVLRELRRLDGASTEAAVRLVLARGGSAPVGAVFRAQAWVKLCAVLRRPSGLVDLLSGDVAALPAWHPWPALVGWLRSERIAAGARTSDPGIVAATLSLARRAATPDLVGLQAFVLLQEGASPVAPFDRIRAHVPGAAVRGWEAGGYDERLARLLDGSGRATDLLPFNFC